MNSKVFCCLYSLFSQYCYSNLLWSFDNFKAILLHYLDDFYPLKNIFNLRQSNSVSSFNV